MTDGVTGYNAQLLYERLVESQAAHEAAQAHLRALAPALDAVAAAIVTHRGGASATVIGQIRDLLSPLGTHAASGPAPTH
jgi:hypothetical protein